MGGIMILRSPTRASVGTMFFTAIVGIVLGLIMLFYPGGTMTLMKAGFRIFQGIISILILYYFLTEAIQGFKGDHTARGVLYLLAGAVLIVLLWILPVDVIYFVVAIFLAILGISEIASSFVVPTGKGFLLLLGLVDLMVAVIILIHPMILAILIAWYVLFWGFSRLLLAFELKKSL